MGARGTFYVSGGLVDVGTRTGRLATPTPVVSLPSPGHEIGCHHLLAPARRDLDQASLAGKSHATAITSHALDPAIEIDTSLTRFGYGSLAANPRLKDQFRTCRSIMPGVNAAAWICSSFAPRR